MTMLEGRVKMVMALGMRAAVKEKVARLSELADLIPQAARTLDGTKNLRRAQEAVLDAMGLEILAKAVGKNETERKANAAILSAEDQGYQEQADIVRECQAGEMDDGMALGQLEREWRALSIAVNVFVATLNFLAGSDINIEGEV